MLDPALKQSILEAFEAVPDIHIRCAMVFGLMAAGRANSRSDLDLAVDAGRPLTAVEKMQLIDELALRVGRPVDLVDVRNAGCVVLGEILKRGVRVVVGAVEHADRIRRYLFDSADFGPYLDRIRIERRRRWIGY